CRLCRAAWVVFYRSWLSFIRLVLDAEEAPSVAARSGNIRDIQILVEGKVQCRAAVGRGADAGDQRIMRHARRDRKIARMVGKRHHEAPVALHNPAHYTLRSGHGAAPSCWFSALPHLRRKALMNTTCVFPSSNLA